MNRPHHLESRVASMVADDLLSNKEIAEALGVSGSTVDRIIRRLDRGAVKRRNAAVRARRRTFSDDDREEAQCLLAAGAKVKDVEETLHVRSLHAQGVLAPKRMHLVLTDEEASLMRSDYTTRPELGSCRALAERYGVSHDTAARVVRGLKSARVWQQEIDRAAAAQAAARSRRPRSRPKRADPQVMARAAALRHEGRAYREIAEGLGVAISTVWNWCKASSRPAFPEPRECTCGSGRYHPGIALTDGGCDRGDPYCG